MTAIEFDQRFTQIELEALALHETANAHKDQKHAALFIEAERAGQTQEWIAQRVTEQTGTKKTRRWVGYRLCFGRFLAWLGTSCSQLEKQADSLTEGRFRTLFGRTTVEGKHRRGKLAEVDEHERFRQVMNVLNESTQPEGHKRLSKHPGTRKAILAILADGEYHSSKEIRQVVCEQINVVEQYISKALWDVEHRPPAGHIVQSQHAGHIHQYRLRKADASDREVTTKDLTEMADQVLPIIDELTKWGNTHMYEMNPAAIKRLAIQLEKVVAPFLKLVPA